MSADEPRATVTDQREDCNCTSRIAFSIAMPNQLGAIMRRTSRTVTPAICQKYHPLRDPASLPNAMKQSAGGFCNPRSKREIAIDEQCSILPKSV
jgi:hypothetical protein